MIIGLLRNYKIPAASDRVAALNIKEFGHEPIFFSINDVDFDSKIIKCKKLIRGKWTDSVSEFPDVVYNDLPPIRKADPKLYKKLEDEGIPFTTHRLGLNKSKFINIMEKNPQLHKYMIETANVADFDSFYDFLMEHRSIVMKPNRGHKGIGVTIYEFDEKNHYITKEDHQGIKIRYTIEELKDHLQSINLNHYHLQKKVTSYTKTGIPFVIRSYIGKTGNGKWMNMFQYAAVSTNGNHVVNISQGSGICFFKDFCKDNYGEDAEHYQRMVQESSMEVAKAVQKEFDFEIDALGLDYGLTKDGKLYLYEVNAFPGTRPFDAKVVFHAVRFAIYLGQKYKKS